MQTKRTESHTNETQQAQHAKQPTELTLYFTNNAGNNHHPLGYYIMQFGRQLTFYSQTCYYCYKLAKLEERTINLLILCIQNNTPINQYIRRNNDKYNFYFYCQHSHFNTVKILLTLLFQLSFSISRLCKDGRYSPSLSVVLISWCQVLWLEQCVGCGMKQQLICGSCCVPVLQQ